MLNVKVDVDLEQEGFKSCHNNTLDVGSDETIKTHAKMFKNNGSVCYNWTIKNPVTIKF